MRAGDPGPAAVAQNVGGAWVGTRLPFRWLGDRVLLSPRDVLGVHLIAAGTMPPCILPAPGEE